MEKTEREKNIEALYLLLDYSILIPDYFTEELKKNIDKVPDDYIMNLGKILAYEHRNRELLDKKLLDTYVHTISQMLDKVK